MLMPHMSMLNARYIHEYDDMHTRYDAWNRDASSGNGMEKCNTKAKKNPYNFICGLKACEPISVEIRFNIAK